MIYSHAQLDGDAINPVTLLFDSDSFLQLTVSTVNCLCTHSAAVYFLVTVYLFVELVLDEG